MSNFNNNNNNNHCNHENCECKGNERMAPKGRHDFDLFDPLGELFNLPVFAKDTRFNGIMKTDIKEFDNNYLLEVDMPGYDKKDVVIDYDNGYLTITAEKKETTNENDPKHKYIRKERFVGKTSRSFYVGDIDQKEISAKLENGTLVVNVPKEHKNEEKKHIEIQ